MGPVYKLAMADDLDKLWPLVRESLSGTRTRLTLETLRRDLFDEIDLDPEIAADQPEDPSIEFNPLQAKQKVPVCHAITAQIDDELVGYLIFHQFYSPWRGRGVLVDQIYVKPALRGRGKSSVLTLNKLSPYRLRMTVSDKTQII